MFSYLHVPVCRHVDDPLSCHGSGPSPSTDGRELHLPALLLPRPAPVPARSCPATQTAVVHHKSIEKFSSMYDGGAVEFAYCICPRLHLFLGPWFESCWRHYVNYRFSVPTSFKSTKVYAQNMLTKIRLPGKIPCHIHKL